MNVQSVEYLIEENKGLVIMIAKKFLNRGYDMEELVQLGNIGLFKAIKNFDTSKNVKFSTYAVPMIMGEIKRFLRDDGIIKVSRTHKNLYSKILSFKEHIFKTYGYEPSISDISEKLNVDYEQVVLAIDSLKPPEYLYKTINNNKNESYMICETIPAKSDFCDVLLDKLVIRDIISNFNTLEKKIFYLRFYKGLTQTKIAKILNTSQVKVSRKLKKITQILKEKSN